MLSVLLAWRKAAALSRETLLASTAGFQLEDPRDALKVALGRWPPFFFNHFHVFKAMNLRRTCLQAGLEGLSN